MDTETIDAEYRELAPMQRLAGLLPSSTSSDRSASWSSEATCSQCGELAFVTDEGIDQDHACCYCQDALFVRVRETRGPGFGKAVPCPRCRDAVRDEAIEVERLRVPLAFSECRIDTWEPGNARPRLACQSYVVNWPPEKPFLMLTGDTGRGKTHLAVGVMWAAWERHRTRSRFWPVVDLLARYRSTFDRDRATESTEDIDRELERLPLLVLDDLGAQKDTEWAEERLFQLVDRRYRDRKPTVVTTNLGEIQLPPRLKSRLCDRGVSTVVQLDGSLYPDRRLAG